MTTRFYCTNRNCIARQHCANAQQPYRTDQVIIQGQGKFANDCPDFVQHSNTRKEDECL